LFAFSTENWERPQTEIEFLLASFREYLVRKQTYLMKNNVRLIVSGRRNGLGPDLVATIEETERMTACNIGRILNIAFNYGGRAELVDAAVRMSKDLASGAVDQVKSDEEFFRRYLYQPSLPDVDLLIRTSGEQRISNFMLWSLAYAELYFTDILWPDFTNECLDQALEIYAGRERRFGRATVVHESRT
jgi:undecaprenyl diphosphate synthase